MSERLERVQKIVERGSLEPLTLLEKSGAIDLFNDFKETGYLKFSKDASAIVSVDEDKKNVSIQFNAAPHCRCSLIEIAENSEGQLELTQSIDFQSFNFKIFDKTTEKIEGNLEELVARVIIRSNEQLLEDQKKYEEDEKKYQ